MRKGSLFDIQQTLDIPYYRPANCRGQWAIVRELQATYRLVYRDLSASLIPGGLTTVSALIIVGGETPWQVLYALATTIVYFFLYIYTFCLANQIVGIEEDRINKPDRPIPSGAWTLWGSWQRFACGMIVFPIFAGAVGGVALARWALAWEGISVSYNFLGLHRHWFSKNIIFITLGTVVLMAAAWQIVHPLDGEAWRWILFVAITFGTTLHLQDLRDIEGDLACGRRTLPVVLGNKISRVVLSAMIGSLPLVTHFMVMHMYPLSIERVIIEVLLGILNLGVALRTLFLHGSPGLGISA